MLDVYRTRYRLNGEPFRLSPDHRFCFAHPSYANAEAYLQYAIAQGEGFIAITGGPGAGKTTLVNALLAELDETRIQVAVLSNAQLDPGNLVRMVVDAFGLHLEEANDANPVSELEQFLKQQSQRGHCAVLIVDEAQGLSATALEELRLLSNLQHDNRLLLQVFLVGQEQLLDMVHAPGMEHLQQRLIAASHLEPLDLDETVSYVEHRLCHVGWQGDPAISEDALRLIHEFSAGVPRRINLICHRLFLYGGLQQKHALLGEDARHVIDELHKERVLAPELPGEHSVAETDVAKSRDSGLPALSLPRTESFVPAEKPRQRSMQADAEVPAADNIIPLARPVSPVPQGERNWKIRTADRPTSDPLNVESGTGPDKHRHWRLAAVFGVLVGLVLIVIVKTDIGDQQTDLMLAESAKAKSRIATAETAPEKKAAVVPDPVLVSITNSPDWPLVKEIGGMGTIRRDSAFATSAAGLDSAAVSEVEQKDTNSSGTSVTEESPEQPASKSLKATASALLKQEPGKSLEEQREAERLKQEQQVAEKKLAEPPEVAGLEQQPKQKPRPEAADKERRKQHEFPNRQIKPEHEEKLREPGRAAALVASSKVKNKIGWTEESDSKSEHNETQPSTPPGVAENKGRSERMRLSKAAEQRVTEQLTQDRPLKKTPVATRVARSSQQGAKPTVSGKDQLKSLLLAGRWNVEGKPAVFLPSEVTHCEPREKHIKCWSVPQNSNTKHGLALYKVEATLQGFSTGDSFQISYRTLLKLVGGDGGTDSTSDEGRWQVTEHAMKCQFIQSDWVQCRDEKGVTRDYHRSGLT
jgi:type II secretory pathway predicted ATPase ExeA